MTLTNLIPMLQLAIGPAILISGVAVLVTGGEPEAAALRGVVKGLVSFALLWWVLRYDLTTIPAFLATGALLDAASDAAVDGTAGAWALFAAGAVVTVAVAWAVTRYIARPLPAPPAAPLTAPSL